MNLKEQTFAVLAEKPNSIAHNWFQQAFSQAIEWVPGNWYVFDPTLGRPMFCSSDDDCTLFLYSQRFDEAQFEKRLDQENLNNAIKNTGQVLSDAPTLNKSQISGVIDWMNTWEQLKDTVIPLRFEEDFMSKLKAYQENEPKNTVFGKENIAHKSVFHPNGFEKPFKGFTLTKSEAEKILRDKFKLPDYVEFKIVE